MACSQIFNGNTGAVFKIQHVRIPGDRLHGSLAFALPDDAQIPDTGDHKAGPVVGLIPVIILMGTVTAVIGGSGQIQKTCVDIDGCIVADGGKEIVHIVHMIHGFAGINCIALHRRILRHLKICRLRNRKLVRERFLFHGFQVGWFGELVSFSIDSKAAAPFIFIIVIQLICPGQRIPGIGIVGIDRTFACDMEDTADLIGSRFAVSVIVDELLAKGVVVDVTAAHHHFQGTGAFQHGLCHVVVDFRIENSKPVGRGGGKDVVGAETGFGSAQIYFAV